MLFNYSELVPYVLCLLVVLNIILPLMMLVVNLISKLISMVAQTLLGTGEYRSSVSAGAKA